MAAQCDYHIHRMRCNQCAQDFNIVLPSLPTDHQHDNQYQQFWRRVEDIDGLRWFWVQRCVCGDEIVGKPDTGPIDAEPKSWEGFSEFLDLVKLMPDSQVDKLLGFVGVLREARKMAVEGSSQPSAKAEAVGE